MILIGNSEQILYGDFVLMLWLVLCHVVVEQSVRTFPICTVYQRNSVQHILTSIGLVII
jgi:hypothetical protein